MQLEKQIDGLTVTIEGRAGTELVFAGHGEYPDDWKAYWIDEPKIVDVHNGSYDLSLTPDEENEILEIYGKFVEGAEGELWDEVIIEKQRVRSHPELRRIVVSIDPATSKKENSDLRGLYAGASASLDLDYKLGASYVDRDWQVNYDYQPIEGLKFTEGIHWIGVKRRLF